MAARAVEHASRTRASIINDTPRGRFLGHDEIEKVVRESAVRIFESQGIDTGRAAGLVGDFLYGDAKAPTNTFTSIQNCLWCEASRDFANSLRGDVKVIAVNANHHRVFGQIEIPTALQNPDVRSLGSVPVESLRSVYAQHGIDEQQKRHDAAMRPKLVRAWQFVGAMGALVLILVAGAVGVNYHYLGVIQDNKQSAELARAINRADVTLCDDVLCARVDAKARRRGDKGEYQLIKPR